jgi:5-methylcytosine-specific restriction endonuclease McrA
MSILEKITQLHELNTILSKKTKDFSYLIKINIYKSLIDFIDINSENEFIKYFNKIIISFKSSKYYTIGNELQNSINTFIDITDFMFKIDNIKGGLINNNIIDFYNELYAFFIKQFAIYVPSKKPAKKTIEPKKEVIIEKDEEVVKKPAKKTIEPKKEVIIEKEEEVVKKSLKKTIEPKKEVIIEKEEEVVKKSLKKTIEPKNEVIIEKDEEVVKKSLKKTIEPKKIIIEEPKKKELTAYNAFFKEQSLLIKDNSEIKNKMEYIAKLWNENKDVKEEVIKKPSKNIIEKEEEKVKVKDEINKSVKKHTISATIKKLVWNMHIGEEIGKAKCVCCKSSYISQMSFHCGHIIAESKGGEMIVSNLRPICQNCNSSMGNKNMEEFMKTLK